MDSEDVVREMEQELKDMGIQAPSQQGGGDSAATAPVPATPPTSAAASAQRVEAEPAAQPMPPVVQQAPAAPAPVAPASIPTLTPPPTEQVPAAGEAVVPPVPTPVEPNTPEHHEVMGQVLTQTIQRGKNEVPHEPDPLVAKPYELESWRVFKIMSEFVEGFEILRKYSLAVSFFGSARQSFAARFYDDATALAGKLAKAGFAVITGGSAGIMEAANKGAYEAGGASIGLNIRLADSQGLNQYLTDSMTFDHFFVRKVMLTFASEVYIYFPGGFGTLDEFTEILTLVQTKKIRKIPIVLYGREYWEPFTKLFEERLVKEYGAADAADLALYTVVDSVDEAYDHIMKVTKL